jgi:fatty acid synthase subunit alpha
MFGLTIDDIGVASFHGTGTKANDYNESSVLNEQMEHLGRRKGNVLPSVFQKHLTGHPKGAAAAWMLNGVFQILETGIIPGNRNLDNVEDRLQKFKHIIYPSRAIQTDGVKAALLKSFGFGQAGGEILVIHPDYLFGCISESEFQSYCAKREKRQIETYRYYHEMLTQIRPLVRVKDAAPYTPDQQSQVYLTPTCRASFNKVTGKYEYKPSEFDERTPHAETTQISVALEAAMSLLGSDQELKGLGIDVQLISELGLTNRGFLERNFTAREIEYCEKSPDTDSSFAARWAAKESVIKAVSNALQKNPWKSSGNPLVEIEIVRTGNEAPVVEFHGEAAEIIKKSGLKQVKVTLSHSGIYAVAAAIATQ